MSMFIHFFCLCPLSLVIKLNFNISKVAYCLITFYTQKKLLYVQLASCLNKTIVRIVNGTNACFLLAISFSPARRGRGVVGVAEGG